MTDKIRCECGHDIDVHGGAFCWTDGCRCKKSASDIARDYAASISAGGLLKFNVIRVMLARIDELERELSEMKQNGDEMEAHIKADLTSLAELYASRDAAEAEIERARLKGIDASMDAVDALQDRINKLDAKIRRDVLKFGAMVETDVMCALPVSDKNASVFFKAVL